MIQKVLKKVEFPQVQHVDEIVDEPIVMQGQVPTTQTVQKTVEVPQSQFPDRVVDVPVVMQRQGDALEHIMNDCDELIPEWLSVVKGVVASENLPLNIYRETLLKNKILRMIKKSYVTNYLEMFAEIAEKKDDDYKKFYKQFDKRLKLGNHEHSTVGDKTAEFLRFNTSKSGDWQISLKQYVEEDVNSVHDGSHVSNRHMTWWRNAWWVRVNNGPHLQTARDRRRVWRAATRAAQEVRETRGVSGRARERDGSATTAAAAAATAVTVRLQ